MIRGFASEGRGFGVDEFKPDGHFLHRLLHQPKVLLVTNHSNDLLGAVIYGYSNVQKVHGQILGSYVIVKKEHQRNGIGSLLLNSVSDIAINMKCNSLLFDVYVNNHAAITWLYKSGFYCTGSLRHCGYVKNEGFLDCLLFHRKCQPSPVNMIALKL